MKTKLISLLLAAILLVGCFSSFVSCDNGETVTDQPTTAPTETPTEKPTELPATEAPTVDAPESDTEAPTVDATEPSTEKDTEKDTEVSTEKDTGPVKETETEGETVPEGPAEPLCEKCEFKSVKGIPTCKVCGYIAACRGEHGYTADLDGHWKPECEHCGKAAGKSQNHEYEERVVDEGDLLVYSFRCTICKFKAYEQEVPYEINSFYSAGDLAYTDMSGSLESAFRFESGVGYASYSSENGGKSTVIVVSNGEVGDSSGRYLVMKVRLPASQSSFGLTIKSVGAYASQNLTFAGLKSVWTTIIVDVTKAVSVQSVKNNTTGITKDEIYGYSDMNGEYFLGDLRFIANTGPGESFDVAYIMMCETLEDAENFTKNEKVRVIYNDILNERPETDKQQCVDENGNPIIHEYIINDDGTHTLEEGCHQCGLAAVSHEPHSYGQTVNENGDYTYACGACGHSKYGVDVNKYIDTDWINTAGHTYYKINKLGITEDEAGFDYASFSGQSTTAQIIFARTGFTDAEAASAFPVGKANMFVIRMRTNTPAVSFEIRFGTPGVSGSNFRFPTTTAGDGWATYVVDIAALIPNSYVADAAGEYTLQNFYFHIGGADFTSEVIYDVDFMAFVDKWEEVGAVTPDEMVINVVAANVGGWVNTKDKTCIGEHSYTTEAEDGTYKVVCGSCGYLLREYNVSSDIERFMPAESLAGITGCAGSIDLTVMTEGEGEDSFSFVRLDNMKLNNDREAWMGWNVMSTPSAPVSGQYMIMKFRLPKDQLGQTFFEFYTATKQSLAAGMKVFINVSEDDEWHTVVIDLSKCVAEPATFFQPDKDGTYHVRYLQMRLFSGHQSIGLLDENGVQVKNTYTNSNGETKEYNVMATKPSPEMYMDIAYIAYCDNIKEVTEIVDTDTYEFYEASGTAVIRNGADGSCYTHSYSDIVEGETHKITCSGCGNVAKEFTVSKDVNYYADLGAMGQFNSTLSKGLFDEESGLVFNRYEGAANAHLNLTGGGSAGTWTAEKYQTGKYIVIKYRTSGGIFTFNISTKDNGNSKAFPDQTTRPEYTHVDTKEATASDGKWAVALIEITSSMEQYTTDSEQEIAIRIDASGTYVLDIAYVAIVDSEDEAKTLLSEGETFEIGWNPKSGGNEGGDEGGEEGGTTPTPPPAQSDHKITETVSNGENGAKIYTYTCSHCDINITKTVPASVSGYFSADKIALRAISFFQLGAHNMEADGEAFARFTGADKISQALWLRAQADCDMNTDTGALRDAAPVDIGASKFMVIRARTNDPSHSFKISLSTTGHNAPTAISVDGSEGRYNIDAQPLKAGDTYATRTGYAGFVVPLAASGANEWSVYVIDLSKVMADYFVMDSTTQTYILDTFYFHFDSFAASTSLDVSHVGFVESWDSVSGMTDDKTVVNITSASGAYSIVNTSDGSCATHSATSAVVDGKYVAKCGSCGIQLADYNIKAEALGGFLPAENLLISGNLVGSFDREYIVEDGTPFIRIDNSKTNGASGGNWMGFTVVGTKGESYVGRYMVIRFRIGENGLSQSVLEFYASTQKGALTSDSYVAVKAGEDNEWHTVVVDLSTRIANPGEYFVAENGVYNIRYLQIRPFSGAQPRAEADDYMDISYIGFCDSLDNIKDIVGDSYELSVSKSENKVVSTVAD